MSWCEDYIDPFPRDCEHGVPNGINCSECKADEDADYASAPHPSAYYEKEGDLNG